MSDTEPTDREADRLRELLDAVLDEDNRSLDDMADRPPRPIGA